MDNPLFKFLSRNDIKSANDLPLAHTTRSYYLYKILKEGKIVPRPCDVFEGENLSYLFYGRPGYKFKSTEGQSKVWELPSVIIIDYKSVKPYRIHPFDTGGFSNYPDFISMMNMSDYEVGSIPDACNKLIGAFFVDSTRYFKMSPRSESSFIGQYGLGPLDAEIQALHSLAVHSSGKVDDRRLSIEVQTNSDIFWAFEKTG